MEGLAAILQTLNSLVEPVVRFAVWLWPVKVYWLHDGERGVITTFGRVRRRGAERGPGITVCWACEELTVCQAVGGYIDLPVQQVWTADGGLLLINIAVLYDVRSVRMAILQAESLESTVAGVVMNEVREYARGKGFEAIAENSRLTSSLTARVNRKLAAYGSVVTELLVTDLRKPDVVIACDAAREIWGREG